MNKTLHKHHIYGAKSNTNRDTLRRNKDSVYTLQNTLLLDNVGLVYNKTSENPASNLVWF